LADPSLGKKKQERREAPQQCGAFLFAPACFGPTPEFAI
jgi:hypothetical protein